MSNNYKKFHNISYIESNNLKYRQRLVLGTYGIKACESFNISKDQIAQYKAIIVKILKKENKIVDLRNKGCFYSTFFSSKLKVKVSVFPFNTKTSKSQGSRMGKGKGAISFYYAPIKAGQILFELINVDSAIAFLCLEKLRAKVPVRFNLTSLNY